jgi:hypothetical protein
MTNQCKHNNFIGYCAECDEHSEVGADWNEDRERYGMMQPEVSAMKGINAMSKRDLLLNEIVRERDSQDEEWGGPDHDDSHDRADWVRFIEKQCRLAQTAASRPLDDYESRMVKIAALAVAAVESSRRDKR